MFCIWCVLKRNGAEITQGKFLERVVPGKGLVPVRFEKQEEAQAEADRLIKALNQKPNKTQFCYEVRELQQ